MMEQRFDQLQRHGSDVRTGARRIHQLLRTANRSRQNLRLELKIAKNGRNVLHQFEAGAAFIFHPRQKWTDVTRARFGRQQRLHRRKAQRDIRPNAFARQL